MSFNVKLLMVPVLLLVGINPGLVRSDDCDKKAEIVCYFASWALYRSYEGRYTTDNIDPLLCTKIIYSFVGLNIDLEIASLDPNADISQGGFFNMTALKLQNPCLKSAVALGGWNEGSIKYSIMASNENSRKNFAEKALKFIAYYGFDGLDLDWEYPTSRGGIDDDKENFATLLRVIKETFAPWNLTISIAVGMQSSYYDVASIAKYADYVHLMAYDIVPTDSDITGLLAPQSVIEDQVKVWIDNGLSADKLIVGVPTYARCFNLEDSDKHDIGAVVVANTTCGGIWTDQDGFLSYYEVEEIIKRCGSDEVIFDGNAYTWCLDVWMTYDNEETVAAKTQYVLDKGLGGVMVWSLDTDDFLGMYSSVKYPLVSTMYNTINGS